MPKMKTKSSAKKPEPVPKLFAGPVPPCEEYPKGAYTIQASYGEAQLLLTVAGLPRLPELIDAVKETLMRLA